MRTLLLFIPVVVILGGFGFVVKAGIQQWAAVQLAPVVLALHR